MKQWEEVEIGNDPSLIFVYKDKAVHDSLGEPNAPILQEASVEESDKSLEEYVYALIEGLRTRVG